MAIDFGKKFKTDKGLEENGVKIDLGEGASITIARLGNKNYQKKFQELAKPHKKAIRLGVLSDEVAEDMLIKALADSVLLGFEGFEEDGEEIVYSLENAEKLLKVKDFRTMVMDLAGEAEAFRKADEEEAVKN